MARRGSPVAMPTQAHSQYSRGGELQPCRNSGDIIGVQDTTRDTYGQGWGQTVTEGVRRPQPLPRCRQ
jgi:hypothetical protein